MLPDESRVVSQRGSPVMTWLAVNMLLGLVTGALAPVLRRGDREREAIVIWEVSRKQQNHRLTPHTQFEKKRKALAASVKLSELPLSRPATMRG
jgi:hypothetical protein